MSYSRTAIIRTVAAQEVRTATRNKAIIFSIIVPMIAIVVSSGLFSWLSNRSVDEPKLALVGISAQQFESLSGSTDIELSRASDRDEAISMVDNDADAALIYSQGSWELLADGTPDDTIAAATEAAAQAEAHQQALNTLNVTADDYIHALPAANVSHTNISEDTDAATIVSAFIGVMLVIYFIMLFAGNIGGRVTEEKSSRVIEIILASARPMDFLAGKLLGNLAIGLAGTVLVGAVGVASLPLTGIADNVQFQFSILPLLVVAYLLGMLFFSAMWAAAGSLVSRAEDLASTQAPLLTLLMVTAYAPFLGMAFSDSNITQILSWIPPFSLTVVPLQYTTGEMSLIQAIGSYAILALAVVAVLWLAARIYRNSILQNGQKGTWLAAIRG